MSTCTAGHLDTACPLSPFYTSSTRWWTEGRQIVQTAPSCWRIKAADLTFHHHVGHMCFPPHPSCHTHHVTPCHHATPTIPTMPHHTTMPHPPYPPCHTHPAMPMSHPVTTPCTTIVICHTPHPHITSTHHTHHAHHTPQAPQTAAALVHCPSHLLGQDDASAGQAFHQVRRYPPIVPLPGPTLSQKNQMPWLGLVMRLL